MTYAFDTFLSKEDSFISLYVDISNQAEEYTAIFRERLLFCSYLFFHIPLARFTPPPFYSVSLCIHARRIIHKYSLYTCIQSLVTVFPFHWAYFRPVWTTVSFKTLLLKKNEGERKHSGYAKRKGHRFVSAGHAGRFQRISFSLVEKKKRQIYVGSHIGNSSGDAPLCSVGG